MSQFRIAVIGAEQLDPEHHSALNSLSEAGTVAAFALDLPDGEEGYSSLSATMQNEQLDAVILAVQRPDIAKWVQFCVQNAWPTYVTHAVPETIEEMIEIRRAEQMTLGSILQFGFTARHHDSFVNAFAKADSGEYGHLMTLRGVCGTAGSDADRPIVFDLGAQMIDIMQAFAGPFQDITGFGDLDRTEKPGSETNVFATLRTHTGTIANLHISASQWRPTFRLELGFERGYLWLEGLNSHQNYFGQEALIYARTDGSGTQHETVDRFEHSDGALASITSFIDRIRDPSGPVIGSSQDAFDTLNTLQRILAADPIHTPFQERHVS